MSENQRPIWSKYSPENSVSTENLGNSVSLRFSLTDSVGRSGMTKATAVSTNSTTKNGAAVRRRLRFSARRRAFSDLYFPLSFMRAPQKLK